MELSLPPTFVVSVSQVITFLLVLVSLVWAGALAYRKILSEIHAIRQDIESMKLRNIHADRETEDVKREQAAQKTAVAVMAEQMNHVHRAIERVEGNVVEILRELRSSANNK
jgi:GTP1/Obg family GTP-binding protein